MLWGVRAAQGVSTRESDGVLLIEDVKLLDREARRRQQRDDWPGELASARDPFLQKGMTCMEALALVLSGISLVVAVVGTVLSNKRASEALVESRKAATVALWSGAQEAVQRLIGFDPASEPIGERLPNLRIAMIALVDELDGWEGFDEWLEAERALGACLARQVVERAKPGDTVDERLKALDPYQQWAQVLSTNLRRFRAVGYDEVAALKLRDNAADEMKRVCEANGWPLPPTTIPGLRPLDSQ